MLFSDLIKTNTVKVSNFKVRNDEIQKSKEQQRIDANFSKAIGNVKQTVFYLRDVKTESDFKESQEVLKQIQLMLKICKSSLEKKFVTNTDVTKIGDLNRNVNRALADEWKMYYSSKTSSIKEILSIAKKLSIEKASVLINEINLVEQWGASVCDIVRMKDAIDESYELIEFFELNDIVVGFLKKMISQQASLDDLTVEVKEWIEKEGLQKRIKLSFGQ